MNSDPKEENKIKDERNYFPLKLSSKFQTLIDTQIQDVYKIKDSCN